MIFWVFHVIRDYADIPCATAQPPGGPAAPTCWHRGRDAGGRPSAAIDLVFGHNDLLPPTSSTTAKPALWLIDWDYAGFNSPLFDLANLASNNELDRGPAWRPELLGLYFARPPKPGPVAALRCHQVRLGCCARQCGPWSRRSTRSWTSTTAPTRRRTWSRFERAYEAYAAMESAAAEAASTGGRVMSGIPHASRRSVIIGGGIVGCSTAYHLARLAHKADVLLLERGQAHLRDHLSRRRSGRAAAQLAPASRRLLKYSGRALRTAWKRRPGWPPAGSATAGCAWRLQSMTAWTEITPASHHRPQLRPGDGALDPPKEALDRLAADGCERPSGRGLSCRPTARPTHPTSPRLSGQGRAHGRGRASIEGRRDCPATAHRSTDGRISVGGHGPPRARSPVRVVVNCAGQWAGEIGAPRRRDRAAAIGAAPVS